MKIMADVLDTDRYFRAAAYTCICDRTCFGLTRIKIAADQSTGIYACKNSSRCPAQPAAVKPVMSVTNPQYDRFLCVPGYCQLYRRQWQKPCIRQFTITVTSNSQLHHTKTAFKCYIYAPFYFTIWHGHHICLIWPCGVWPSWKRKDTYKK